ncbi:DUF1150 family protein [Maritimibacter sp. UBA3975]|uniref:DUF1150 family protein n=1 Tax=Maritimibacter sp. UBA3975 TaxID=1946833 RepID=UPI000C0BA0E3|nr:DUF1150 family protein [Maritimibacter sp. UBA3975]MAM63053.1 hypothetical protein [Maritimibacter sp.]|tara:strand:+ start:15196 stop:15423 length:228 start_codon:yes stop_codon:yes gene_type:complete
METNEYVMTEPVDNIVYVREVDVDELPDEIREQVEGDGKLYGVHSSEGERLALVGNRNLAFALARQNELSPVAVH